MIDNRTLKLLEAFSGVDEDLVERCENAVVGETATEKNKMKNRNQGKVVSLAEKLKKNSRRYGSAVAAVVCVAVVGLAYFGNLRMGMNDSAAFEAIMEDISGGAVAPENAAGVDGAMQQTASAPALYNAVTESVETDSTTEQVTSGTGDGLESVNGIASGQTNDRNADEKVQQESSVVDNGGEKSAAMEEMKAATEDREESAVLEDSVEGCKEFVYVTVTEAEARAHALLGAYVPTELPDGYALEGAYTSAEGEAAALMLSWCRGMDSIMINITKPTALPETIDVTKTEMYDEYLYEIPQAETVPEEYKEVFHNPVCAWEDFSLEFVRKRMISRGGDAGDTDTPRGNFSVLYPDGVLIYFNGRGTAEEIWTLFGSMDMSE